MVASTSVYNRQIIWKPLTNFGYFSFRRIFAASEPLVILLIFNEKHAKTKREIASEAVESKKKSPLRGASKKKCLKGYFLL